MKAIRWAFVIGTVGLCLLAFWLRLRAGDTEPAPAVRLILPPPPPRNACEAERREARLYMWQARGAVIAQLERLEAWDPDATNGSLATSLSQELMATDKSGCLRRAREIARRAAALAATPADRYETARLLYVLERDSGNYPAQLRAAQTMVAAAPGNRLALVLLQRAARSNGDQRLEQQATAALSALPPRVVTTPLAPKDQRSLPTARPDTPYSHNATLPGSRRKVSVQWPPVSPGAPLLEGRQ
jgi:hypothetical protein